MDRRHYLALLAAVGTAGCNTDSLPLPGEETPTPESTPTETEAETETPTETDTETPTETERPLSAEEQQAETRLQEADEILGSTLDRYAAEGDAETFLEVRASGGRFDWPPIERTASEAAEPLEEARKLGRANQRERADALGRIRRVVVQLARAQSALGSAYPRFDRMQAAYVDERFADVNGQRDQFESAVSTANDRLENGIERYQPADADACDALDREDYESKIDQLRAERDALLGLSRTAERLTRGMRNFRDGVDRFEGERWTPAMDDFGRAEERLSTSTDALTEGDVDDEPFDDRYAELVSLVDALAGAAGHLVDSASAYRDRNRSEGNARLEDAKDVLEASRPARRRHTSARKVLDHDGR